MCSAMSEPSAASYYKFLAHGQAHVGQMANNYDVAQLQV